MKREREGGEERVGRPFESKGGRRRPWPPAAPKQRGERKGGERRDRERKREIERGKIERTRG